MGGSCGMGTPRGARPSFLLLSLVKAACRERSFARVLSACYYSCAFKREKENSTKTNGLMHLLDQAQWRTGYRPSYWEAEAGGLQAGSHLSNLARSCLKISKSSSVRRPGLNPSQVRKLFLKSVLLKRFSQKTKTEYSKHDDLFCKYIYHSNMLPNRSFVKKS